MGWQRETDWRWGWLAEGDRLALGAVGLAEGDRLPVGVAKGNRLPMGAVGLAEGD